MKIKYHDKIGGYDIIRSIANVPVDSEATKLKIAPMLTPEMTGEEINEIYNKNLVLARVGDECCMIDDSDAEFLQKKLDGKGKNQLLLSGGDYIDDYRGVEYWVKTDKWEQLKIQEIGVALPHGAVLQENLTSEQNTEISEQREKERIADLAPEKREEEKLSRIRAIAREANQKAEDAELTGEDFDSKAWFDSKKAEIESAYK